MKYYDTVIIGAGLAGATLGNLLLREKRDVIIFEKRDLRRKDKLCGGIVTEKSYRLLLKIYGDRIKKINFRKFSEFRVRNDSVIKEINNQTIYTVNRKELDDFVVNEFIENGGVVVDNTCYERIDFKNKIIYVSGEGIKYNQIVGADGVFSRVRTSLINKQQKMNFAIESELMSEDNLLQIDFLDNFKGYAWTISNSKKTLIGLGDVSGGKDIKSTFLNHFNLEEDVKIRGAFLPTGSDIFLGKGDVFLIGDAAGLASSVIGEGIYYALSSAYNLSKTMNYSYSTLMLKDRYMIFSHRILKPVIYNTRIRKCCYKYYGRSRVITYLTNFLLKILLWFW